MLNQEIKTLIYNYIYNNYNGKNRNELMYKLHLELEDIFFEVRQDIQDK